MDLSGIKTKTFNGNILSSSYIANVLADFENDWKGLGLIAIGVVEIAHLGFNILDGTGTSLPHHGDVLVVGDGSLTDRTSDGIEFPVREGGLGINAVFEIDLISSDFGIDERKLITIKVLDECHGVHWIEPHLGL